MNRTALALLFALLSVDARAYDSVNLLDPVPFPDAGKIVAATASADRIYVLDEKGVVFVLDREGKPLKKASIAADGPRGIAAGPDGRVFVADTGHSAVLILDADGKVVGSFGARGSEPGRLRNPESVAVGQDGRVYVADTGNNRVQVFTPEGILLVSIGEAGKLAGQLRSPKKVAVDASDEVLVLDSGNGRVQKFDATARPTREWQASGGDIAVDAYGYVFELDGKGKVVEHDGEGSVQGRFGNAGSGPGQLKKAEGVAIGPGGELLIVDTGNKRLQRVELPNKDKTTPLPPNMQTKLIPSGPSRAIAAVAETLAVQGGELYAWLPKEDQLVSFGADGKVKTRFVEKGAPKEQAVRGAQGVAVSAKLGVFVADGPGNRVQQLSLDGKWKQTIAASSGVFDSKKKEGRVKDPRGVALTEQGALYVADAGNRRVDAFNAQGVFLTAIGPTIGQYELQEPVGVAWDPGRFLYILDKGLKKVIKTEPSGAYRVAFGEPGSGPGQFQEPVALAFDGRAYVYILDAKNKRVSVYNKDGRWQTDLFAGGSSADEHSLMEPVGLAVEGSKLYVADKGRGKVQVYDLHHKLAAPLGLAAASKEGSVSATWKPLDNTWVDGYEVFRATQAAGPYASLGKTDKTEFEDDEADSYGKVWYRVSAVAKGGEAGVPTAPVEVTVNGAFNKPLVELSTISIGNIFSANYKWYLKNPAGTVVVTNNSRQTFESVKLTFRLKDFMDFGYDTEVKKLAPRQSVTVPLIATLNNKILEVSEDTPVQAEFSITYFQKGESKTVSLTKPLRVYSRNAITWDDPRRIATFVTPKDPPVLEFARAAEKLRPRTAQAETLNESVVSALTLWDALSEHGVSFFSSPNNPYEKISEDPNFPVDYTQFPRETLKRKSGQCDDLTTLLASMLDAARVRAAVVDYPGHMALMFDTEATDPVEAGLPEDQLIKKDGTYWVPLETTMIGKPFEGAVSKAASAYKTESAKGKVRIIDLPEAWRQFEPATLPPAESSPMPAASAELKARLETDAANLFTARYESSRSALVARVKANPGDADAIVDLGLLEHQAGKEEVAEKFFEKAAAADPKNAAALSNLGSMAFIKGDFQGAETRYQAAVAVDAQDPELWLNLARAQVKLKSAKAKASGAKAKALDASLAPAVDAVLKGL